MKKSYIYIFLTLIVACALWIIFSSSNSEFSIENAEVVEKTTMEFSLEGGNIKALYLDGAIQCLNADIYGESYRQSYEFYYTNDLTYITHTEIYYVGTIYSNPNTNTDQTYIPIKEIQQSRYILADDALYKLDSDLSLQSNELKDKLVQLSKDFEQALYAEEAA